MAGAQTLILAELEKQYGGSAEAAASAGMGPITQLTNQLSDLSEQIGARLVPFIKTFVTWITGLAEKFDGLSESTKDNIIIFGLILAAVGPVLIIIGKMSVGVSSLIPVFAKLTSVMMANPWLLLAAAIVVVSVGIYKVVTALTAQYDSQKNLNELNQQAAGNISEQLSSIHLLTTAIDDENTSLEDKRKALNTLKDLYPGYYDEIDETTFSQDMMTASTERLKKSLVGMARLEVYKERLKEVVKELSIIEERSGEATTSTNNWTKGILNASGIVGIFTNLVAGDEISDGIQSSFDTKAVENLKAEVEDLTNNIFTLEDELKEDFIDPKKILKK